MALCRRGPGGGSPTRGSSGFTRLIYSGSLGTSHVSSTTNLLGRRVRHFNSLAIPVTGRYSITTNNTLTISHSLFSKSMARGVGGYGGVRVICTRRSRVSLTSGSVAIITANPLASNGVTRDVGGLYNSCLSFCSTTTPVMATSDVSPGVIFNTSHCNRNNRGSCLGYPFGGTRCRTFVTRLITTRNTILRSFSICRKYVPVRGLTGHKLSTPHFNPVGPINLMGPTANRHP